MLKNHCVLVDAIVEFKLILTSGCFSPQNVFCAVAARMPLLLLLLPPGKDQKYTGFASSLSPPLWDSPLQIHLLHHLSRLSAWSNWAPEFTFSKVPYQSVSVGHQVCADPRSNFMFTPRMSYSTSLSPSYL